MTHFIHVTDPPIRLHDGDQLIGQHLVGGGALYGRVLFTEHLLVEVCGKGILIQDCVSSHDGWRPRVGRLRSAVRRGGRAAIRVLR